MELEHTIEECQRALQAARANVSRSLAGGYAGERGRSYIEQRIRNSRRCFAALSPQQLCYGVSATRRVALWGGGGVLPVMAYGVGCLTLLAAEVEQLHVAWAGMQAHITPVRQE